MRTTRGSSCPSSRPCTRADSTDWTQQDPPLRAGLFPLSHWNERQPQLFCISISSRLALHRRGPNPRCEDEIGRREDRRGPAGAVGNAADGRGRGLWRPPFHGFAVVAPRADWWRERARAATRLRETTETRSERTPSLGHPARTAAVPTRPPRPPLDPRASCRVDPTDVRGDVPPEPRLAVGP